MKKENVDLKKHNLETFKIIEDSFKEKNHVATVQATGTGKSYLIAKSLSKFSKNKTLFLTSSTHIIDEFKNNFPFLVGKTAFMTYKKLTYIKDLSEFLNDNNFDLIILDEYHRCGARTWGRSVKELLLYCKDIKVLGTTATPVRYLDNCRDMTKELFNGEPIVEISLLDAIKKDILPKPKYILSYYNVSKDISELKVTQKLSDDKKIKENIQYVINNINKLVNVEDVLKNNITSQRKFIIFCSNITHLKEMYSIVPKWFNNIGFKVKNYSIYTDIDNYNNKEMKINLDNFKKSKPKNNEVDLLFAVNALNEGLHIDELDGIIFLRKTVSPIIAMQQLGRVLKSDSNSNPIVFDLVDNINNLSFLSETLNFNPKEDTDKEDRVRFDYNIKSNIEVIDYISDLNNLLKSIDEEILYSKWNNFIEALQEFKNENGHCNIPVKHRLYKRCLILRKNYLNKALDIKKIEDLNNLGFEWSISVYDEKQWQLMFNRLVEFKNEYGHCNVPRSYKDKELANWVHTQRKYRENLLPDRKEKLIDLGFEFQIAKKKNDLEWELMFNKLLDFKNSFGHVNVSSRYEDKKLANWVNSQRKAYKGGKMDSNRYFKLLEVGFKFPQVA